MVTFVEMTQFLSDIWHFIITSGGVVQDLGSGWVDDAGLTVHVSYPFPFIALMGKLNSVLVLAYLHIMCSLLF